MKKLNDMNKKIDDLTQIPKDNEYEGYLWMSDSEKPTVLKNEKLESLKLVIRDSSRTITFNEISNTSNPFIVEGQLYCKPESLSYSIKYVDGKHLVIEYDLKNAPAGFDEKRFIPNRMDDVSRLKFQLYWKVEPDETGESLCEGMGTYVPAAYVFVGFIKKITKGGNENDKSSL